jgi:hypothetical protein
VAVAACASVAGGTAAYAGALPAPIQELAHVTFGAPAPRHGVPAPRPASGSSRQPAPQGNRAKSQPGLQEAQVKGQNAHPDGAPSSHQKARSHKVPPHAQPGRQGIPWHGRQASP